MTKPMRFAGLFALCATLAFSTAALADDEVAPLDGQRSFGIIKYAKLLPSRVNITPPLPTPGDPPAFAASSAGSVDVKGPIAMSNVGMGGGFGNALVAPRGGAMSTPRQIANREIRKMIRLID